MSANDNVVYDDPVDIVDFRIAISSDLLERKNYSVAPSLSFAAAQLNYPMGAGEYTIKGGQLFHQLPHGALLPFIAPVNINPDTKLNRLIKDRFASMKSMLERHEELVRNPSIDNLAAKLAEKIRRDVSSDAPIFGEMPLED